MSIEAMKQALMDMTKIPTLSHGVLVRLKDVEVALRQAIEQAEKQEPVAWMDTRKTWVDVSLKNVLKEKNT